MKWKLYRLVMRLAHRYNWHYAPPIYPDGDTQLWCTWCGFRQTIKRHPINIMTTSEDVPKDKIYFFNAGQCVGVLDDVQRDQ